MSEVWWSWLLGAIGVFGLYLTTKKLALGFAVGLFAQLLWISYAIATKQYGFITSALAFGAMYTLGLVRWTRQTEKDI